MFRPIYLKKSETLKRSIFYCVWFLVCRFTPPILHKYRIFILNLFGANLDYGCYIYGSVKIWEPKNLTMNNGSCLGPEVNVYNVGLIKLENDVTISQFSYLCTAGHDYKSDNFQLIADDILIKTGAWIGAKSYIGGGVVIGSHAVIGACSTVTKSIAEYTLVAGNPAEHVKSIK
jgi:putative colanic acid biosynthesis acetyltransferase WcaF